MNPKSDIDTTVSDLWSKWADARQAPGSAAWMFAPDHPRLRTRIYDTYLDGLDPISWVRNKINRLPARHGLEIGCGGGDLALAMVETGICTRVDAFDLASGAIEGARRKATTRGIDGVNFYVADGNALVLPQGRYDLVYASYALHHIENLEQLFEEVSKSLLPDGLFFAADYIGPSRMQYSDAHLALMNRLLMCLPEQKRRDRFREGKIRTNVARVPIETFMRIDPSEGARAGEIVPLMRRYFDVEIVQTGMTLFYEVLLGIIHNFDADNAADNAILDLIFIADQICAEAGIVEPCFACLVARPKVSA